MGAPVWQLNVDLTTRTATFTTGMADAAKAARGAFTDIKSGAGEMGGTVSYSTMEARHSVMMLGEEFGIRLPRALTSFIASIGPLGPALEAAFPFLAIAMGATILMEHLIKMHEAGQKLTEDQTKFGTAVNNAFNSLEQKLIQAEIKSDELKNDHLGALKLQLELIDKQSMAELVHSFSEVAKAAEPVMKDLEGHWYKMGIGSDGAKNALVEFQVEYDNLLSKGEKDKASGLLAGTLAQAEKVRQAFKDRDTYAIQMGPKADNSHADYAKEEAALKTLRAAGLSGTKAELEAQTMLVAALQAQVNNQREIVAIQNTESHNAKTEESKKDNSGAMKHGEELIRYNSEVNRMMAADDRQSVEGLQQRERESIEITVKGGAERVAAISAAMQEEEAYGRAGTAFYRQLAGERVQLVKQMADEEAKLSAEAAREDADNTEKMGMLALAAERQRIALEDSARRVSVQQQIAEDTKAANEEYQLKMAAFQKEITGLDKSGKDYENKLKQLQDKEAQLTRQHENELTAIKDKAEQDRNQRILAAENQFQSSIASELTRAIMGQETWAKMTESFGREVVAGAIQNALLLETVEGRKRLSAARTAGAKGMEWGWEHGGVAAPVLGPVMGALAFAATMAFAEGTDRVPGVTRGDTVPAMLSPGEGVVPGGVMDGLRNVARAGGFGQGGPRNVVHFRPTYNVQTIDGDGWGKALDKHADQTQRHIETTLRKLNR